MPKREKILLCIGAVFLVLLFLLSSTDLIIKERAVQIDSISVILSEDTDDYYQNFRKGMEKAATDLRSDVRLITLYDQKDQEQQIELAAREIRWGWGCGHRTGRGKKSSYGSGRLKTGMPGDICGRIFSQRVCDRFTFH